MASVPAAAAPSHKSTDATTCPPWISSLQSSSRKKRNSRTVQGEASLDEDDSGNDDLYKEPGLPLRDSNDHDDQDGDPAELRGLGGPLADLTQVSPGSFKPDDSLKDSLNPGSGPVSGVSPQHQLYIDENGKETSEWLEAFERGLVQASQKKKQKKSSGKPMKKSTPKAKPKAKPKGKPRPKSGKGKRNNGKANVSGASASKPKRQKKSEKAAAGQSSSRVPFDWSSHDDSSSSD